MIKESIPHQSNLCGGNFQDWLEVNLIDKCNGKCSWCIEGIGWHPKEHANWIDIVNAALDTGKKNIILLGGEPTLHPHLQEIITALRLNKRKVWLTTNGSKLRKRWILDHLSGLTGINVSIHHYDFLKNREITGIHLVEILLDEAIHTMHDMGIKVRFNCNLIEPYINTKGEIYEYIAFAHRMNVDSVRFAELKLDTKSFINLVDIFGYKYGLNNSPFNCGCHKETTIKGMPVSFRQMCGLQTPMREAPVNPIQKEKQVLYYDGKIYSGWQFKEQHKEISMPRTPTNDIKLNDSNHAPKTSVGPVAPTKAEPKKEFDVDELIDILKQVKKHKMSVGLALSKLVSGYPRYRMDVERLLIDISGSDAKIAGIAVEIDRFISRDVTERIVHVSNGGCGH